MAKRLSDGSIKTEAGRILYADSPVSLREAIELITLLMPAPLWPFVSGGGGALGVDGPDGSQGNQGNGGPDGGPQGPDGPQGRRGPQGNQGNQGNQGIITVGAQGNSGNFGNQGNQGAQGFQGSQGSQAAVGANSVSFFEFTHTGGSASTGALGFTPLFCVYTGAMITDATFGAGIARSVGFAKGTGALAKSVGIGVQDQGTAEVDSAGAAGDTSAIGGDVAMFGDPTLDPSFINALDVSAFSAAGITLTWEIVFFSDGHAGKLMVVGTP